MSILRTLGSWFLGILFFPLVTVLFLPLKIYKLIVIAIARLQRPDLGSTLTPYDAIFAVDDFYGRPYAGNGTLLLLNGHLQIDALRQVFCQQILSVRNENTGRLQFIKLFQVPRAFGGYFFWSNLEELKLERQIRVHHQFVSDDHENELNLVVGRLMTAPFPAGLWEVLLLENFHGNQSVIIFRIHHVLGDGYTFNHLVDRLIGQESEYLVKTSTTTWNQIGRQILTGPSKLLNLYLETFTHKSFYSQRKVHATGVISMTTLDLEVIKKVRRLSESHFATVGMCLLAGALRRYLVEEGRELPLWISIMHSLPRAGHPLKEMVNHWGVGLFKIPMLPASPLERLRQAEINFGNYMEDQYKELLHIHMPLFNLLPSPAVRRFFATNFGTSVGFTSVPGYGKQASCCGLPVTMMLKVFGLQWRETAVAAAVYTQNSNLGFSIFANRDILPTQKAVDRVTKVYLLQELQELVQELGIIPDNNNTKDSCFVTPPSLHGSSLQIIKRSLRTEGFA